VNGWRTPFSRLRRGELLPCFYQRGIREYFMHPLDAQYVLKHGIVLNGVRYDATKVDEYPGIGAWQIRVVIPEEKDRADSELVAA
jgi:hypothetical protein